MNMAKINMSGLCSIIIPTFNALELTKKCVHTIFQNTSYPFEIIFIDNGSSDGTVEYLESEVRGQRSEVRIEIIKNKENLGFAKACNQGVLAAQGEYILLLNSDAAVTPGWLTRMIEIYKKVPNVGIVSPLSPRILNLDSMVEKNNAQGDITSELEFIKHLNSNLTYSNTAELDLFAGEIWNRYQYNTLDMNILTGFCMLLSHNIISTIGLLDEKFGIGLYEDNDYCWRVKLKGFKLVLAIGVYIHHHMSGSFTANKIDMRIVEEKNREYFFQKKAINEAATNAGSVKIDLKAKEHGITSFNQYFTIYSIRLWNRMNSGYLADVFYRNKKNEAKVIRNICVGSLNSRDCHLISPEDQGSKVSLDWEDDNFKSLCEKAIWNCLKFKLVNFPQPPVVVLNFEENNSRIHE